MIDFSLFLYLSAFSSDLAVEYLLLFKAFIDSRKDEGEEKKVS